jgi:hypothetical protein
MKAKICIGNHDSTYQRPEYVVADIPGIPQIGSDFYLSPRHQKELIDLICKDHDSASNYDIYYGKHRFAYDDDDNFDKIPLSELKESASVGDFHYVNDVAVDWDGSEYILVISLTDVYAK